MFDGAVPPWMDRVDADSAWPPCEHCGQWAPGLEMHHRKFRSRGGDWRPANIIGLCSKCHQQVTTDHTGSARTHGLAVSQVEEPEQIPVTTWYAGAVLLDNLGCYTPSLPIA